MNTHDIHPLTTPRPDGIDYLFFGLTITGIGVFLGIGITLVNTIAILAGR